MTIENELDVAIESLQRLKREWEVLRVAKVKEVKELSFKIKNSERAIAALSGKKKVKDKKKVNDENAV